MNGSIQVPYNIYKCDCCGKIVEEAWPHTEDDKTGEINCFDCSFINGYITEEEWLKRCFDGLAVRAKVVDGTIYAVRKNQKFPWEKARYIKRHKV